MQAHSLGHQDPISAPVGGQPSCREAGLPTGLGSVDRNVDFDQQVTDPGGNGLPRSGDYVDYQEQTSREIPVFVLTPFKVEE